MSEELVDVGEAESAEINLDDKGEPVKEEAPKEEKVEVEQVKEEEVKPVSYTHLTLPTILLV